MAMTSTTSTPALAAGAVATHAGPFGLICLAVATVHFSLHQAGFIALAWLGIALFHAAVGMICAGMAEMRQRNAFTGVLYGALGLFWLSLLALIVLPGSGYGTVPAQPTLVAYLGIWGLFCAILASGAAGQGRFLQFILELLALFLFLMAAASVVESASITLFAFAAGIGCGIMATTNAAMQWRTRRCAIDRILSRE